jgi:Nucleotidyl transferase AbiEii toxin, Type IV TA system
VSPQPRGGDNRFGLALHALSEALAAGKTPVVIIGGIALNANGVTRSTADIDATIPGADLDLAGLLRTLKAHAIVPRIPNARAFARTNQVLLLRHAPTRINLDVSLAWISFELEAIARGQRMTFATARIRVARPEDLVIYKLIANRPRDLGDLENLLLLHRREIDLARVRTVLRSLTEHLDGQDRLAVLDEILAGLPAPRRGAARSRPKRRRG